MSEVERANKERETRKKKAGYASLNLHKKKKESGLGNTKNAKKTFL